MQKDIDTAACQLGVQTVRPIQRLVITHILESALLSYDKEEDRINRYLILLPTGSGKSLCFQVPTLLLPHPSIIVFPLLSILYDQERRFIEAGIPVFTLRGALSNTKLESIFSSLTSHSILLSNPETLLTERVRRRIKNIRFSHMVIDEAHCVYEWGSSFRPAFKDLGILFEKCDISVLSAFTATADARTVQYLRSSLFLWKEYTLIQESPNRTNIHYRVCPSLSPTATLRNTFTQGNITYLDKKGVENHAPIIYPCIIFANKRRLVERTARLLQVILEKNEIFFYHAGLSEEEKHAVEKAFFKSTQGVLVATCAYGMGIDKPNIRTVIHLLPPLSLSAYLQESGRAGRDKKPAYAVLFFSPLRSYGDEIDHYCTSCSCRRETLLQHFGYKSELCSACDVCDQAKHRTEALREILGCISACPTCFTKKNVIALLGGFLPRNIVQQIDPTFMWDGILSTWFPYEIEEALDQLIEHTILKAQGNMRNPILSLEKSFLHKK